jgi:hypothetical protein
VKQKVDGESKMEACQKAANATLSGTAPSGRAAIQMEVDELLAGWENYQQMVDTHHASLKDILIKWDAYSTTYDSLTLWVKDAERKGKDIALGGTVDEKKSRVSKLQVIKFFYYVNF